MKSSLLSFLTFSLLIPASVLAQGPLAPPPGAPAPTMKSLDQIEPARPLVTGQPGVSISAVGTITISLPGSYYLTGPLTVTGNNNGLSVQADDVSVDLRGFSISSTGTGGRGIDISHTRISVRNGTIRGSYVYAAGAFTGSGFDGGIDYVSTPGDVIVSDMLIEGVHSYGIDLGPDQASVVRSCVVRTTSMTGIRAGVVTDSAALIVGTTPISAGLATGCIGKKADGTSFIDAPAPQADQRIPISSLPFSIGQSGSYYLTKNLGVATGDAISINVDGVSLDLGGFSLTSSSSVASGVAIQVNGSRQRISICNGSIGPAAGLGAGFSRGIYSQETATQPRVTDLSVTGVSLDGINIGVQGIVQRCITTDCKGIGIVGGEVSDCVSMNAGVCGITGLIVTGCRGTTSAANPTQETQSGITGQIIINSIGISALGTGLAGSNVSHSTGSSTSGSGIVATIVEHSSGLTSSTSSLAVGLAASMADTCRGSAGGGSSKAISAAIAISCTYFNGILDVPASKQFNM